MRIFLERFLKVFVVFALLLNYSIPFAQISQAAENENGKVLTVAEAIAENSGQATVAGYVVGYVKAKNNIQFEAPFPDDYNFALADTPGERDPAKILPVQITSGFRANFGLKSNPGILGKKVYVTGSLEPYFSMPGLKSPTDIRFEEGTPEQPPEEQPGEGETLTISDIQGEGHFSPYKDRKVKNVQGVVTFVVDNSNFYIQSPNPDNDPDTSEGLLVYKRDHGVRTGNLVEVSGTVKEWVITSGKKDVDLPVTEINADEVRVLQPQAELPEPVVLDPPAEVIDNDGFSQFDPEEDAIDYYESLEGMRVSIVNPLVAGPQSYGEIPVLTKTAEGKTYTTEGGILLTEESANPERIFIDVFDPNFDAKTGDRFLGTVTGVLTFDYSNFKVLTDKDSLPELAKREFTPPVTRLKSGGNVLTVATYNIENYYSGLAEKTEKIAKSIVVNLNAPDIIGLVEMQDNDGEKDSGTTAADANYEALIQAIKAHGGPAYQWTDIAPKDKADGGAPGGNIRVGFLYNPERVQLVPGKKGTADEAVQFENGKLTLNPGRIDPANPAFTDSRKPLAAQFRFNGEDIIVIANHFNSKGGDDPLYGVHQPPVLKSETQRMQIAEVVHNFVAGILAEDPEANVIVLGDLNDFQFANPLKKLKGNILENLIDKVPLKKRYSYIYEGNSQVLDHILATKKLAAAAKADIVHINAPYMEIHGRASDHDPVIAQFDFGQQPAEEKGFALTVMHTNDTHANVEQFPFLATAVDEVRSRAKNSLLLHAGDVFSGTLYFNTQLGQADLYFMNAVGYDAMTFGNHEFDKGSKVLADFVKGAKFPFVSANIDFSKDALLGPLVEKEIGQPGDDGKIYPAVIEEIDGEKVGIFGLTTEDTPTISSPSAETRFSEAKEKAEETVESLEDMGIDKIIALSHLGYDKDLELAKAVDGIDVIVGGHTHTVLEQGVLVDKEEPTVIVQAGERLNYLGVLDVTFDERGVVRDYEAELLPLNADNYAKDAVLEAKVQQYKAEIDELLKEVVGATTVDLDGERANVRTKETNLGNLIADGMVWKMKQFLPETTIALQNGGGIRASIKAGDITMGDVRTVLPFENTLVAIQLTGEELLEALEHSVSAYPAQSGGFLQVSGLRFKFDPEKPAGERVWFVEAKNADGKFEPLKKDALYTVATNSFTAKGGDGYDSLKRAYEDGRMKNLDIPDYEVFSEYLRQFGPVSPQVEGRIVAEKQPEEPGDGGTEPPGGDQPGDGEPGGDQPGDGGGQPGDDQPGSGDQPGDDQPGSGDQPGDDQPGSGNDQPGGGTEPPGDETGGGELLDHVTARPAVKGNTAAIADEDIAKLKPEGLLTVEVDADTAVLALTADQVRLLKEKRATVQFKNRLVSVAVPAEALPDGPVKIEMKRLPDLKEAVSAVYDFNLYDGNGNKVTGFNPPVTLAFHVRADHKDNLNMYYYNEGKKQWELVPGAVYKDGTVSAQVSHFSIYTVSDKDLTEGNGKAGAGSPLPDTATGMFQALAAGLALILASLPLAARVRRAKEQ
jgi:2',3'-cyclic-nucleotide 2'-phosphodiesterase (5'-nucleotidase family)/predicted extracellular nuclease